MHTAPVHNPAPHINRRIRRGFTLMEVMLASVLGLLIIIACMGIFKSIQLSDRRQQIRMEDDAQFASTHRIIGKVFHRLLMAQDTSQKEGDIDEKLKKDDERNSDVNLDKVDEDAFGVRMALQPDPNMPGSMIIGSIEEPRRVPIQTLQLTLTESPVPGFLKKTPEEKFREQLIKDRILLKASQRVSRGKSKSSEREGGSLDAALAAADRAAGGGDRGRSHMDTDRSESGSTRRSAGSSSRDRNSDRSDGEGADDRTASERADDLEESAVRAKGVRGVFEVRPDSAFVADGQPAPVRSTDVGSTGQVTYSLWWRELPPLEIDNQGDAELRDPLDVDGSGDSRRESDRSASSDRLRGSDGTPRRDSLRERGSSSRSDRSRDGDANRDSRTDRRSAGERQRDQALGGAGTDIRDLAQQTLGSGKEVRLLSGLTAVHWSAFRGRKERDKITAQTDRELPAFIELELITETGRREKWMFDVAWVTGPEPGSVLPDRNDPLNNFRARDGGGDQGGGGDGGKGGGGGSGGGSGGGKDAGGGGKGGGGK